MLIKDILEKLEYNEKSSIRTFEVFILNLINFHQKEKRKHFVSISNDREFGDAVASGGIETLEGEVLFEIKRNINRYSISQLENLIKTPLSNKFYQNIKHLVIVTDSEDTSKISKRLYDFNITGQLPYRVHFWGLQEIDKLTRKYRKQAIEIVENIFKLRIESTLTNSNKNWKHERTERLQNVRELYNKGQFSFFLGAGVSSSAGMPTWNTLLNSLFVEYITSEFNNNKSVTDEDILDIVKRLNDIDEPSSLMAARYLRRGLNQKGNDSSSFIKSITKSLYRLRNSSKKLDSDLIQAICSLCKPKRTGTNIKSIVTYNFDDLVERQLIENEIDFQSIYSDIHSYELDELPIYHVHGFLPENGDEFQFFERSSLVFSEEGYHKIYSDSYHWSNLVQLNNLRENNCLMVGLSMTDPNLRRLLEIASRNSIRLKHFAFMKRIKIDAFIYDKNAKSNRKKQIIKNKTGASDFLQKHHLLNEALMQELGVTVLWYEKYDEIPEMLMELKKR